MAARIDSFFDDKTKNAVLSCKLLVVGAGGIGCELLKNLVLTGFEDIHVIDLDTIDVSNLNRQFLFQKSHVGKSKAEVAKESAGKLNPKANITAYHDSITNLKYNVEFYRQFSAVANALDNMAARKHVNRMCLAAEIPLIESGSAGYLGQVTVYKKKLTECYECIPRPAPKDYPTCTIRNTPSESIHCIVWAKYLFNQLFGEEDSHQDVSPDPSDKLDSNEKTDGEFTPTAAGDTARVSTREWAKGCQYNPRSLFKKLFHDDVEYLLEMKHLWESRRPPIPLIWENLPDAVAGSSLEACPAMKDQEVWSPRVCAEIFEESLQTLQQTIGNDSSNVLTWDKDDKHSMDFVAACANLRSYCFGIPQKSRFQIKSMAGNIVPAIATTNAIIGGLIVLQLLKALQGQFEQCRTVVLNKSVTASRNKLLAPCEPAQPNPKCFVCSTSTPEVYVKVNISSLTVKTLEEKVLIEALNMIEPDAVVSDGKGTILISSDPEEDMQGLKDKTLSEMGIQCGSRLQCDDFFQQFTLTLVINSSTDLVDQDFEIVGDISHLKPTESEENSTKKPDEEMKPVEKDVHVDEGEEIVFMDDDLPSKKRKFTDDENGEFVENKRSRPNSGSSKDVDIIVV